METTIFKLADAVPPSMTLFPMCCFLQSLVRHGAWRVPALMLSLASPGAADAFADKLPFPSKRNPIELRFVLAYQENRTTHAYPKSFVIERGVKVNHSVFKNGMLETIGFKTGEGLGDWFKFHDGLTVAQLKNWLPKVENLEQLSKLPGMEPPSFSGDCRKWYLCLKDEDGSIVPVHLVCLFSGWAEDRTLMQLQAVYMWQGTPFGGNETKGADAPPNAKDPTPSHESASRRGSPSGETGSPGNSGSAPRRAESPHPAKPDVEGKLAPGPEGECPDVPQKQRSVPPQPKESLAEPQQTPRM